MKIDELVADLFLADVFVERARPQRALERLFLRARRRCGDHAIGLDRCVICCSVGSFARSRRASPHAFASSFSACLMPSATAMPSGSCLTARDGLLVAVAERQQRVQDVGRRRAAGRCTPTAVREVGAELVLELEQQALGGLLADAGDLGQPARCPACVTACASSATDSPGQHGQRDARADAADLDQLAERAALVLACRNRTADARPRARPGA